MTTATRYPTTNAAGATGFTNAGNAYASDDSYATAAPGTLDTISSYFGGFDFASYIPSGATINSVMVYCERRFSTTASNASSTLRPYNGTTALASENENTSEPTSDTVYSVNFGALGVTDVRSADFRILVGAKRGSGSTGYTYYLDVVYVVVDYTATAAYSLTCDQASFTLSVQAVSLLRGLKLTCDQASYTLSGQAAGLLRAERILCFAGSFWMPGQACTLEYTPVTGVTLTCDQASFTLTGQDATFTHTFNLACDQASFTLTGQAASLARGYVLAAVYASYTLTGQDAAYLRGYVLACESVSLALAGQEVTLTYTIPGDYTLEAAYATYTLSGQDLSYHSGFSLVCLYGSYTYTGYSVTLFVGLWEPSGDMITFGTLLTRIQSALGDDGSIWSRNEVIWPFAIEAIRAFPILRPSSVVITMTSDKHTFTLPSDFRAVIYVEFPCYQDPPQYLMRKNHLDVNFYSEPGFFDVDRDYVTEDKDPNYAYAMWVSNNLVTGDVLIVRYNASHTTEFANEYSYITVENQYVHILISHVVYMCFQERLAKQLQDPTAFSNTIAQLSDAVKIAETTYVNKLNRAVEDLSSSERISGWKVDKHDRIY